jgi:protein disulfide isomerase family A protein 5
VKYFKDGKVAFDAGHAREEKAIVEFMSDPKEPPPPPPPEKAWSGSKSIPFLVND